MGKIIQETEKYILLWYNTDVDRWISVFSDSYNEAVKKMAELKRSNERHKQSFKYRIVKETTKQEVVYDE
jgi:hypothetical protein